MQAAVTQPKCHKPNTQTFIIGLMGPMFGKYPLVGLKPINGKLDRFADAQFRPPADSANAARVEKDEWNIADPTAVATRIGEARIKTEPACNPTGGILHLAIFVRAEIEDVDLGVGALDRRQHGLNAIGNVKIGFTLQPVAEDVQGGRILREFLHKIEYVTVGVALSEN